MAISDWSTNPNANTSVGGIAIGEGCPPSNLNNAIRELMAELRTKFDAVDAGSGASASALNSLTPAADRLPYFTGSSTAAITPVTAAARALLDDGDAATMLATLGAAKALNLTASANGLLSLPIGGTTLVVQWGTQYGTYFEGGQTVSFNTPFPNACYVAMPWAIVADSSDTRDIGVQQIGAPNAGYFDVMVQKYNGSPSLSGIGWIAIGN